MINNNNTLIIYNILYIGEIMFPYYSQNYQFKFVILLFLFFNNIKGINPHKHYTILTYIAGDNNLEPFIDYNIKSMAEGANKNVNILAFINRKKNSKKFSKQLVITKNKIEQEDNVFYNLDSGKPETVIKAVRWAFTNYPADHYMLVLWDHGSGSLNRQIFNMPKAVCYDDTTGSYLKDFDLISILEHTNNILGRKLDILAFDACLMAELEIAFVAEPFVDYMVSSQEVIPGYGYDYEPLISYLKNSFVKPAELTKVAIDSYHRFYKNMSTNYTLSSLDLSYIKPLVHAFNNISTMLLKCLEYQQESDVTRAIVNAASPHHVLRFEKNHYMDIYNFLINLKQQVKNMALEKENSDILKQEILTCIDMLKKTVIANTYSNNLEQAHGLSIYFPFKHIDHSYKTLSWYAKTEWGNFLNFFFKSLKIK